MRFSLNFQTFKRAAIIAALFFGMHSQAASGSTETYQDIIEKAYNLNLQKDRAQAISLLLGALKRENKKTVAQRELSSALNHTATVFYSDKAQQLYELALSLKESDPNLASSKLQEASRLEADNAAIEVALERLALSNGDCAGAAGRLMKQKELVPLIEEIRLVAAQLALCQGKFSDYLNYRGLADIKNSSLNPFWQTAEMEYLYRTGAFIKAQEMALNAQKQDAGFPEPIYWQWKAEQELKVKSDKAAQKYVSLCKTLNSRQRRQYLPEPLLCHRTTEVETFLKKNNNSES
jgi:hypothetical protein